jgi:uncharacterized protein (DUF39 family)
MVILRIINTIAIVVNVFDSNVNFFFEKKRKEPQMPIIKIIKGNKKRSFITVVEHPSEPVIV